MINQLDKNGEKHGPWEEFYDFYKGIMRKAEYKNGAVHGLYKFYRFNGVLLHSGVLKNRIEIGLWYEDRYKD